MERAHRGADREQRPWTQTVTGLTPGANYLLSGWIPTEGVTPWDPAIVGGANLSLWGTWLSTPALTGATTGPTSAWPLTLG